MSVSHKYNTSAIHDFNFVIMFVRSRTIPIGFFFFSMVSSVLSIKNCDAISVDFHMYRNGTGCIKCLYLTSNVLWLGFQQK